MNRAAPALAALAASLAVALTGCAAADTPDGPDPTAATVTATAAGADPGGSADVGNPVAEAVFTVTGGARSDGPSRLEVARGDTVRIAVTSDTAEEVHVHGYDLYLELAPGVGAVLEFEATLAGVYEVELHNSGGLLTQLRVS